MSPLNPRSWLLPAGIGALIVVLVVVALLREPVQLDPTTPEGTVQVYLQAIDDEDYEAALEVLDPEIFSECTAGDFRRFAPHEPFTANFADDDSDMIGSDRAQVSVTLRFGTEGPFDSSYESFESFTLVSREESWRITDDPWPYFYGECIDRNDRTSS